jgi:FkbM family methyltransferase
VTPFDCLVGDGVCLVDVGGRGKPRAEMLELAAYAHLVVFEPDLAEADRLGETLRLAGAWRGLTVVGAALAQTEGVSTLYLTVAPGMSSLLRPDPDVAAVSCIGDTLRVVDTAVVNTMPLDLAAERYGFVEAHLLKLDTQGTELDILRGGERLLTSVLAVYVETLFLPFYRGQSVFADVDAHLRSRGFVLHSLARSEARQAGFDPTLYSRRQIVWAHCLYLRDRRLLETEQRRRHYAALALAYGHVDSALAALDGMPERDRVQAFARTTTTRLLRKAPDAETQAALLGAFAKDPRR